VQHRSNCWGFYDWRCRICRDSVTPRECIPKLLNHTDAVSRCQRLLTEATPSGQLYGLLGLRLLDRQSFEAALPRYKISNTEIQTMHGRIMTRTTAGKIANQIEKGELKRIAQ